MSDMPLDELGRRCAEETRRYGRDEPSDQSYCLEIFRRALLRSTTVGASGKPEFLDPDACELLFKSYRDVVRRWLRGWQVPQEVMDDLEQEVWMRFWRWGLNCPPDPFANRGLGGAINMLKRTALSAALDDRHRRIEQRRVASLDDLFDKGQEGQVASTSPDPFSVLEKELFRAAVQRVLADNPLELRIYRLRYEACQAPREIEKLFALLEITLDGHLLTKRKISDILERAMGRLEKDPEIRELLGEEPGNGHEGG